LHVFGAGEGLVPLGALVKANDGNLYGTTQSPGTIYQVTPAGSFSLVHWFVGGSDGALPVAGMVVGGDGLLYGTTIFGGAADQGTVYRFDHIQRTVTVIYSFRGFNAGDGAKPYGRLYAATNGDLYGTTFAGGPYNLGTVFRITRFGVYSVLHAFDTSSGAGPFAGVVEGNDGWFYGTTRLGTIYRLSAAGAYETLRQLNPTTEGATLHSQLVKGTDGNLLYGTAREGGPHGHGTVFRLTVTPPSTVQFDVIYAFTGGADGSSPDPGLALGPDGNLYGTTVGPYTSDSGRVVYRITPSGQHSVLHTFAPEDTQPFAPLTIPGDGAIYGTTRGGPSTSSLRAVVYRLANVFPTPTAPFGSLDTPGEGQTVAGEVPVTGWALDDARAANDCGR
jgi:uncharacterized repeat protein (TIGR03803 family)